MTNSFINGCILIYYQETRPSIAPECIFSYEEYLFHFKTGDLIAYSETGILAACVKANSHSTFSRLGMIVELPNRWTNHFELYVMEVTRNIDRLIVSNILCIPHRQKI